MSVLYIISLRFASLLTGQTTDPRGNSTVSIFDLAGRRVESTDAASGKIRIVYAENFDLPASVTDEADETVYYRYDIRGRKTAEWGTSSYPICYLYDDADRLVSVTTFRNPSEIITTDPTDRTDGDTTRWSYHEVTGLVISKTLPDGSQVSWSYDRLNRELSMIGARGIETVKSYAPLTGELIGLVHSDGTPGCSYAYNQLGQVTEIDDGSQTVLLEYDRYGIPASETGTGPGSPKLVYKTDDFGRSSGYGLEIGGHTVQELALEFDAVSRLALANLGGTDRKFAWSYDPVSGFIKELAYPNGMIRKNSYKPKRDLIDVIDYWRPSSANMPARHAYEYDRVGRTSKRKDTWNTSTPKTTRSFSYNGRGELLRDQLTPGGRFTYSYDNIGSRRESFEFGNTTDYAVNNLNQYVSIARNAASPFIPEFDADGNQTLVKTTTGIWRVAYDAHNRPASFTSKDGQTVVECRYDYMGRRYEKKVILNGALVSHTRYLYRGYLQVAELDMMPENPRLVHTYLWDPAEPVATRILMMTRWKANATAIEEHLYYMHDALKNVTSLFGEQRGRRALYEFRPFGGIITAEGNMAQENKFRFSCEYMDDELGMIYYNFRYLNPLDGRWISRDPSGEAASLNLYSYLNNAMGFDWLGLLPSPKKPSYTEIYLGKSTSMSGSAVLTVEVAGETSTVTIPITGGEATGKVSMGPPSGNTYNGMFNIKLNQLVGEQDDEKYPDLLRMLSCCPSAEKTGKLLKSAKITLDAQWNINAQQIPGGATVQFGNQHDNVQVNISTKDLQRISYCPVKFGVTKKIVDWGNIDFSAFFAVNDAFGPSPTYSGGVTLTKGRVILSLSATKTEGERITTSVSLFLTF